MLPRNKILDRQFFPTGALIIMQGDIGGRAYLIESGKVEVFTKDPEGKEIRLAEIGPGSLIGEMSLISGEQRSASVRALHDATVVAISAEDLRSAMNTSESLYKRLTGMLVNRTRSTQQTLLKNDLHNIEKTAQTALENIAQHIPAEKQPLIKKEMDTLRESIQSALERLNRH